jgi:O-antigen ligase
MLEARSVQNENLRKVNYFFTIAGFALPGIIGSLWSVILHGAFIVGCWRILNGSIKLAISIDIIIVAVCFFVYAFSEILSFIVNERGLVGIVELLSVVIYLSILPVYSRLKISSPNEIWSAVIIGSVICCLGAGITSLVQLSISGFAARAEGGSGNSAVFANVIAIFGPLSFAGIATPVYLYNKILLRRELILLASIVGGVFLFSTSARFLIVAGLINYIVVAYYLMSARRMHISILSIVLIIFIFLISIHFLVPNFMTRISSTYIELLEIWRGGGVGSISERILIWKSALRLSFESPIFGFGPDSVREVFGRLNLLNANGEVIQYSHFHNVFLTALMRGGLIEVASVFAILVVPLALTFIPKFAPLLPEGKLLIRVSMIAFIFAGVGGVVFGHDIIDSVLCYLVITGFALRMPRVLP